MANKGGLYTSLTSITRIENLIDEIMKASNHHFMVVTLAITCILVSSCSDDEPGNLQDNGSPISSSYEADQAFDRIKAILVEVMDLS